MTHLYDDLITGTGSNTDYWRLDRDTDELNNLKNTGATALTSSNVSSGSDILPGVNNLYSDSFNGSSSYVWGSASASYTALSQSLSVEAWIEPSSIDTNTDFVGIVVKSGSFGLCLNSGEPAFFTKRSTDTDKRVVHGSSVLSTDTVYHLMGTYNYATGVQTLYVNGSQVDQQTEASGQVDQNASGISIGSWDTSVLFFAGDISNVALYNSAESSAVAASHYTWNV